LQKNRLVYQFIINKFSLGIVKYIKRNWSIDPKRFEVQLVIIGIKKVILNVIGKLPKISL